MKFETCINKQESILMEGALGERLKREYHLSFHQTLDMGALVYSEEGRNALNALWSEYADIAYENGLPFMATTPTRRTNKARILNSGYDENIIYENVRFLRQVKSKQKAQMYIGGMLGCKGDAYTGIACLEREESKVFHEWEVKFFADAEVDFLYAALIPTVEEALGLALAIENYDIPYIISFTIRKDGCLTDGTRICDAIELIDSMTKHKPICYMTNCVHPSIVYEALSKPFNNEKIIKSRFWGIQANTSKLSYEELDGSKELKASEPEELAKDMVKLRELSPIKIFGGCCGTDGRHMAQIAQKICHK